MWLCLRPTKPTDATSARSSVKLSILNRIIDLQLAVVFFAGHFYSYAAAVLPSPFWPYSHSSHSSRFMDSSHRSLFSRCCMDSSHRSLVSRFMDSSLRMRWHCHLAAVLEKHRLLTAQFRCLLRTCHRPSFEHQASGPPTQGVSPSKQQQFRATSLDLRTTRPP